MLQCVAVSLQSTSVMQCIAVCCNVLQCAAVCCSVLQCRYCSERNNFWQFVLLDRCVAACCSVLQCVAA